MSIVEAPAPHKIVSPEAWLEARLELLAEEKELTRRLDAVRQKRLEMPWVKVEKEYTFAGPNGALSLADLFNGRSQLIVNHFMLPPSWDAGCPGCSFGADHVDGALVHLNNKGITFTAVSRAPYEKIAAYKQRMGWRFPWASSFGSDFNYDFHVSFTAEEQAAGKVYYNYGLIDFMCEDLQGHSAFYKDASGAIYHTYSSYARGGEATCSTFAFLDMAPLGRDEHGPYGNLGDWVRRHDEYPHPGDGRDPGSLAGRAALPLAASSCCSSGAKPN